MKYGTIKQEAAACRRRFKGVKIGSLVWFCHHEKPLEFLTENASARIAYILENKLADEKAIRLHWFRPFKGELPDKVQKAYAEWEKAYAEREKAYAEWQKAAAEWKKAYAEFIPSLIAKYLPGCPWDGEKLV